MAYLLKFLTSESGNSLRASLLKNSRTLMFSRISASQRTIFPINSSTLILLNMCRLMPNCCARSLGRSVILAGFDFVPAGFLEALVLIVLFLAAKAFSTSTSTPF